VVGGGGILHMEQHLFSILIILSGQRLIDTFALRGGITVGPVQAPVRSLP
jgi:hypothetical protein